MEYKKFKKEFRKRIEKELGKEIETSFREVERNNRATYEGLEVGRKGDAVSAILPLEELYGKYQNSGSMEQTISEALKMFGGHPEISADMVPKSWEAAKVNLRAELMHYGWNWERLRAIPHRGFLNLAVAYRVELPMPAGHQAGILVNTRLMELWGVTEGELYETAMENLGNEDYHVQSMSELLGGMIGNVLKRPDDMPEQYVLTNAVCRYGAAGMLREDILETFAEQAGGNFYILPSSVHELILVPDLPSISAEGLKEMVKDVNEGAVAREEWLSENVYYYDCETREVKIGE